MDWIPLLGFPIEWAALALLALTALYGERSGFTGLGVEGALAAAMIGFLAGYEATADYALASLIAAAAAVVYGLVSGVIVHLTRSDPAVGSFALSLVPVFALSALLRGGELQLLSESPLPGIVQGTPLAGLYAEDLVANPWLLASPVLILVGTWILRSTPFGLRLRAFGENPAWRVPGTRPLAYRLGALALGALWTVPAAALLLRAHPDGSPFALGYLALGCVVAARWSMIGALGMVFVAALLRTLRPYGADFPEWTIAIDAAPYLFVGLCLAIFARRSLRLASSPQARTETDTL
jgi:simple sugar transport system permease protein